jgi:hypothetical protein
MLKMRKPRAMDRRRLDLNIEAIRRYTAAHPELLKAHHFLYDLPLSKEAGAPEIVVMGINPGETAADRLAYAGPTEETWNFDFHEEAATGRSRGSKRWRELTAKFTGGRSVVFTELFFWSSSDHRELLERFDSLWGSPHLKFCIDMNRELIEVYQPRAVIFVGLSNAKKAAEAFCLQPVNTLTIESTRVVEHYQDGHRPWFFTKHWTGSRGFTTAQREAMRNYLLQHL